MPFGSQLAPLEKRLWWSRWLLRTAALGFVYALVAMLSVRFARFPGAITPVWPLSGLVLAVLLRSGLDLWPGVLIGDFLVARWLGYSLIPSLTIASATTFEALLGAVLIRRRTGSAIDPSRLDDLLLLLAGSLLSTLVGGCLATALLWQSGIIGASDIPSVLASWWAGDTMGVWLVTPLLLAWIRPLPWQPRPSRLIEAALLMTLLTAATAVVFSEQLNYAYLLLVCLLWAALRLGLRGTTLALALVSVIAIPLTAGGGGPFTRSRLVDSLVFLQTFLGVLSCTALVVQALLAEQRRNAAALQLVADVSAILGARGQLAAALEAVARRVARDALDVCCIEVREEAGQIRRVVSMRGGAAASTSLAAESELMASAAAQSAAQLVSGTAALAAALRGAAGGAYETGTIISAPLRDDAALLGVLVVARSPERPRLRRLDVATLVDIARRMAQAVRTDQLEAQVLQARKLESLGRLAGGIAHDFNNLLTVIRGNAELASDALPADHQARYDVDQIGEVAQRGAMLVRQLLLFARRQPLSPTPLDVNAQLEALAPLIQRVTRENIAVTYDLTPRLALVLVDATQFDQMVVNLALNARDAMPEGGRLTIATSLHEGRAPSAREGLAGRIVRLTVRDTGIGMTRQVTRQIFEPFFTTKPAGKGTGLGLSTCQALVAQSGGRIQVQSAPGKGTTFLIDLPAIDEPPAQPPGETEGLAERGAAPGAA